MKKRIIYTGVVFLLILLYALLFHYPVGIMDAITQQPAAGFDIRISPWRIIFEPFLGLILYYNRSLYSISEIPWVMVWLFILYLVAVFVTGLSGRNLKWLTGRLVEIPLVAGGLFVIFVLIVFIRWPGNTIVNHQPDTILVATHCHTEYSHDGLIPQDKLWKWMKRNGYDAFFITDHNHHDKTLDFVHAQRAGKVDSDPLVMCGEEFSGSNHLSLLGLKRKFSTRGYSDSTAIDSTRANGGAVIVNHWFDGEHMTLVYYKNLGVDGFEIENSATERYYDRNVYNRLKDFCQENDLIMVGGLDFHGYGNVCSLWNAVNIPGWQQLTPDAKEQAIIDVLTSRNQQKLQVLLYNDRPFYEMKHLFFRPAVTFINYFRTLNILQLFSWLCWMILFTWLGTLLNTKKRPFMRNLIPLTAIPGALFLLFLGVTYFLKAKKLVEFNDVFSEYVHILAIVGLVYLLYALVLLYFRTRKKKIQHHLGQPS